MQGRKDTESQGGRSRHPGVRAIQAMGAGTWKLAEVDARSMRPLLRGGETLLWRGLAAEAARPGDLLLYGMLRDRPRDLGEATPLSERLAADRLTLVVHRVMAIDAAPSGTASFRTKGDARVAMDVERVLAEDAIGVVIAFERDGRRVSLESVQAQRHARLALAISRAGAALAALSSVVDALARRVFFLRRDPFLARFVALGLQRASQEVAFRLVRPAERESRSAD